MTDEWLILWDVVEEHLDEAEFLFEMWERATVAPGYTWRDVERAFGERLRAQLDGLTVAGEAAAKRLLVPGLADDDAAVWRAGACALALLEMPDNRGVGRVLRALAASKPESGLREGIARALTVSNRDGLDEALRDELYAAEDDAQAPLLEVLAARCVDAGPIVGTLLRTTDPAMLAAAVRAAAMRPSGELRSAITALLDFADDRVRLAAIDAALCWGMREGWERCIAEAHRGTAAAIAWVGMLGGDEGVEWLRGVAGDERTRHAALRALGYSGAIGAAEACLRWMTDKNKRTAKLAAEAFGAVAGVDAYTEGFGAKEQAPDDEALPALDDDLAEALEGDVEDELPMPVPEAFARWFAERGPSLDAGRRYLRGEARTIEAMMARIETGAMRESAWLRQELRARTRGAITLGTPRLGARARAANVVDARLSLQQPVVWW